MIFKLAAIVSFLLTVGLFLLSGRIGQAVNEEFYNNESVKTTRYKNLVFCCSLCEGLSLICALVFMMILMWGMIPQVK